MALLGLSACAGDPKTVPGALSRAASAAGDRDASALFPLIDERARFALGAVHGARRKAAELIRASYPAAAQAGAIAELGDAATAETATALFARRCGNNCLDALAHTIGAPRTVREEGGLTHVETVRGTSLTLYRAGDGQYGLVWETDALVRERARAAAELDLIQKNAAAYREQRSLQGS